MLKGQIDARDDAKAGTASYQHCLHRVRTMSDGQLARRVRTLFGNTCVWCWSVMRADMYIRSARRNTTNTIFMQSCIVSPTRLMLLQSLVLSVVSACGPTHVVAKLVNVLVSSFAPTKLGSPELSLMQSGGCSGAAERAPPVLALALFHIRLHLLVHRHCQSRGGGFKPT